MASNWASVTGFVVVVVDAFGASGGGVKGRAGRGLAPRTGLDVVDGADDDAAEGAAAGVEGLLGGGCFTLRP
jgi:hypothetical protein